MDTKTLFSKVEHTVLQPGTNGLALCEALTQADTWGCRGACFPPAYTEEALDYRVANHLNIRLITVAGFPFGYQTEKVLWTEIRELRSLGIDEVDVVGPLFLVKSGRWDLVEKRIHLYREAAAEMTLKVIMETGLLTEDEIRRYCEILSACEVDYAKTSTGFAGGGATPEAVRLMRSHLAPAVKIKASGGIRTREQMIALLEAGADVLGMSRAGEALEEEK